MHTARALTSTALATLLAGPALADTGVCGLLLNGGAEVGTLDGWQADESEAQTGLTGLIAAVMSQAQTGPPDIVFPAHGDYFFSFANEPAAPPGQAGSGIVLRLSQTGCVPDEAASVSFSAWLQTEFGDSGRLSVEFADSSGSVLSADSTDWTDSPLIWRPVELTAVVPAGALNWEVTLSGRLETGHFINTFWDSVEISFDLRCTSADLAPPYGILDLADLSAFLAGFTAQDAIADLNGDGLFDLTDINLFVTSFLAGCP